MALDNTAVIAKHIDSFEYSDGRYFNVAVPYKTGILSECSYRGMELVSCEAPMVDYRKNVGLTCKLSYEDELGLAEALAEQMGFSIVILPCLGDASASSGFELGLKLFSMLYAVGEVPVGCDSAIILPDDEGTLEALDELGAAGGVLVYDASGNFHERQATRGISFAIGSDGHPISVSGTAPAFKGVYENYKVYCQLELLNRQLRELRLGTNNYLSYDGFRAIYETVLGKPAPAPLPDIPSSMSLFDYDACMDAFLDSDIKERAESACSGCMSPEMEEVLVAMSLCEDCLLEPGEDGRRQRSPQATAFADLLSGRKSPDSEAGKNRLAKLSAMVESINLPERLIAWRSGVPICDIIA